MSAQVEVVLVLSSFFAAVSVQTISFSVVWYFLLLCKFTLSYNREIGKSRSGGPEKHFASKIFKT